MSRTAIDPTDLNIELTAELLFEKVMRLTPFQLDLLHHSKHGEHLESSFEFFIGTLTQYGPLVNKAEAAEKQAKRAARWVSNFDSHLKSRDCGIDCGAVLAFRDSAHDMELMAERLGLGDWAFERPAFAFAKLARTRTSILKKFAKAQRWLIARRSGMRSHIETILTQVREQHLLPGIPVTVEAEGDRFVIRSESGAVHSLDIDSTDADRLAAHVAGFIQAGGYGVSKIKNQTNMITTRRMSGRHDYPQEFEILFNGEYIGQLEVRENHMTHYGDTPQGDRFCASSVAVIIWPRNVGIADFEIINSHGQIVEHLEHEVDIYYGDGTETITNRRSHLATGEAWAEARQWITEMVFALESLKIDNTDVARLSAHLASITRKCTGFIQAGGY